MLSSKWRWFYIWKCIYIYGFTVSEDNSTITSSYYTTGRGELNGSSTTFYLLAIDTNKFYYYINLKNIIYTHLVTIDPATDTWTVTVGPSSGLARAYDYTVFSKNYTHYVYANNVYRGDKNLGTQTSIGLMPSVGSQAKLISDADYLYAMDINNKTSADSTTARPIYRCPANGRTWTLLRSDRRAVVSYSGACTGGNWGRASYNSPFGSY